MTYKHRVLLALGTNTHQEENLQHAKMLLSKEWKNIRFSTGKWTEPLGIVSDLFLNCLAVVQVEEDFIKTQEKIKKMERECGYTASARTQSHIVMDIDILQFDDKRLHINDWNRDYISVLLKEFEDK